MDEIFCISSYEAFKMMMAMTGGYDA